MFSELTLSGIFAVPASCGADNLGRLGEDSNFPVSGSC